ncbi:class C sortase [Brotonthovivens ammoniilytica]|uniref:Class C sortase n=1 Tax=Brotonthovivens ammoniilytica TaxID=2981725 RepID=A0ABT2TGZ4_9FIRM|nr:class C sortase [Brotonthovivens ammoniilytica]MCU6761430.1 class C sortase [Brotonthovivens ammoniilytica]
MRQAEREDRRPAMKKPVRTLISILIIAAGAGFVSYPFISNYLYENQQDHEIQIYNRQNQELSGNKREQEKEQAQAYNKALLESRVILSDPFDPEAFAKEEEESYESLLNLEGTGIMGYLEIPVLKLNLGIYHGTGARSLEAGAGHLENSSLPVGGKGTHAVLSAHTGLPGKKLFTDLELMKEGDVFFVHVLDDTLAYEVDQIKVVEPENVSDLIIQAEQDYVTLVTCTPYGVNSHRLLVRGSRIPYEEAKEVSEDLVKREGSQWMRQYVWGIMAGAALLFVILISYQVYCRRRNRKFKKRKKAGQRRSR